MTDKSKLTVRCPRCRKVGPVAIECSNRRCGWMFIPWKFVPPEAYGLEPDVRRELNRLHEAEAQRIRKMTSAELVAWLASEKTSEARAIRVRRATGMKVRVSRPPKKTRRVKPMDDPHERVIDDVLKSIDFFPPRTCARVKGGEKKRGRK